MIVSIYQKIGNLSYRNISYGKKNLFEFFFPS